MDIGKKIKTLRSDRNWSSTELSQRSGLAQSTISDIESNKRSPQVDTLEKICRSFNIPITSLFPSPSLTPEELQIIEILNMLSLDERKHFIALFQSLVSERKR